MPDTSYYIGDESRRKLFDFIISINGKVIPDLHYNEPQYELVANSTCFLDYIKNKTVRYFIISDKFQNQELLMTKNRFITTPSYHIVQRTGGPYIDLALYRGFSKDATVKSKRTDIGYYAKFLDRDNLSIEYNANEEVKIFYKEIIKFVKSLCKQENINEKKYYIDRMLQ